MDRIKQVQSALFRVPLAEILHDAKHGAHTHFELVTVTIETEQGLQGSGYTYTGGRGGHARRRIRLARRSAGDARRHTR